MKMTSQRQEILNYVKSVKSHPTAEDVYKEVRKKLSRISPGTVYRNLQILKKNGLILEIDTAEKAHFDGDLTEHHHFMCSKCGRILDLMARLPKRFVEDVKDNYKGVRVDNAVVNFNGLCEKCLEK
ncbi:MAG: transcriptional repressor [Nanoarchaeota archaeon]